MKTLRIMPILATIVCVPLLRADLVNGFASIDFDKTSWDALASGLNIGQPVLTLSEFFNQAESNARTQTQLLADDLPGTASYTGQSYVMNGPSVLNLTDRYTQPTTFQHTPGDADGHTGFIGLAGVARFSTPLGGLIFGDYTLGFDSNRVGGGASGWHLYGNIPPVGTLFDLMNVTVVDNASTLSISGRLGVSQEVALLMYNTPADVLRDVGSFSFTANVVPEPASGALLAFATLLLAGLRRRK